MPIYEFRCAKCRKDFESLVFKSDEVVACPRCGGDNVSRLMSGFSHKSGNGKMVSSGGGCASCAGGSCATCH